MEMRVAAIGNKMVIEKEKREQRLMQLYHTGGR
jgi:hypothetical protein